MAVATAAVVVDPMAAAGVADFAEVVVLEVDIAEA
jgi:hypothetical protein